MGANQIKKFLTKNLMARASCIIATPLIEEMRSLHQSSPVATVATGKTLISALLVASHLKEGQEVSLYLRGEGPLGAVFAEAGFDGHSRAYCSNPSYVTDVSAMQNGISTGPSIGKGLLTVSHKLPILGTPSRGTVEIQTGEIGDDVAFFLQQSRQIASVVSLSVMLNVYGRVEAAGGLIIELMPGHDQAFVDKLEARVKELKPLSERLLAGETEEQIVKDFFPEFEIEEINHEITAQLSCRCSELRVRRSVALLGLEEIDDMILQGEVTEVGCEFCGKNYKLDVEDLKQIRQELHKQSLN